MQKIALYFIKLEDLDFVIINNYLKKIASVVIEYFPHFTHSYYSNHFYNNIKTSYKKIVAQKYWNYTYAKTKLAFNKILKEIKKNKQKCCRIHF